MQIYGPSQVHGSQPIRQPHMTPAEMPGRVASPAAGGDQLEISEVANRLQQVHDLPDIRAERVAELRAAIANGTYETSERMGQAVERLLDELA